MALEQAGDARLIGTLGRGTPQGPMPQPRSRRQDDGLARGLRIEELVSLLRLLELPAVRKELLHIPAVVRNELGALGLALLRERPGADQRHLPAQEIGAHVQRHLAALADEARRAP